MMMTIIIIIIVILWTTPLYGGHIFNTVLNTICPAALQLTH